MSPRTAFSGLWLQVAVEHIIWDQKPEAALQALLLSELHLHGPVSLSVHMCRRLWTAVISHGRQFALDYLLAVVSRCAGLKVVLSRGPCPEQAQAGLRLTLLLPESDPSLAFLELSLPRAKKARIHITLCIALFTPNQHLANWTW